MKSKAILLVLLAILITKAGNAQNEPQLLKDVEPDAVMTPEQEKLEVVNTLTNVGNGNYVYHVVRESGKSLQGLVQSDNGEMKVRIPMQYQFIDEISNADYKDSISLFVYVYEEPQQHFAYDLVNEKMIKLNHKGKMIDYKGAWIQYLGQYPCGVVFDFGRMLCGDQISSTQIPMDIQYEFTNARLITIDNTRPLFRGLDILSLPVSQPYRYVTHAGTKQEARDISFLIDFPKGNSLLEMKVKLWISDAIREALWTSEMYIPISDNSPERMVDYYAKNFFFSDSILVTENIHTFSIGCPSFEFIRQWESDSYVTYRYTLYLNESEHKYGPVTRFVTFNKQTGTILDYNHIFVKNRNQEITNIIENHLSENLWIWYYDWTEIGNDPTGNMEDAIRNGSLCLRDIQEQQMGDIPYQSGGDSILEEQKGKGWSFDDINLSLTPEGVLLDVVTIMGNAVIHIYPVIPYEKIMSCLAISPMEKEAQDVFLESIRCAGQNTKTEYKEDFNKNYILSEELLASVAKEQGEESGEHLLILSQLAEEYSLADNTKRAISLRQKYLDFIEEQVGIQNYAWETNGMRQLRDLLTEKEYDKACVIGDSLSKMWPKDGATYNSEIDSKWEQMDMAAEAFFMTGRLQKAISLCTRAIHYTVNEENHLKGITQMSRYQYVLNGIDSCIHYINHSIDSVPTLLSDRFHWSTAAQRKELWQKFQSWYCAFVPQIAYATGNKQLMMASYNAMLFGKGLLLNTESSLRQIIINSGNSRLLRKYETLPVLKEMLKQIRMKWMAPDEKEGLTDEILERIRETERDLIQGSKQYGDFTRKINIKASQVLAVLQDHEIAIEFCLIEGEYYALFLKKDFTEPKMVKLCSEEQLSGNKDIYASIWAPMEEYLKDVNSIYFSPDGTLYNIGIEYAYLHSKDRMPVNEKYRMFRLSSTRELVVIRDDEEYARSEADNSAILYGGIDYDDQEDATFVKTDLTYRSAFDLRSLKRGSVFVYPYLPGTEKEVEIIGKTLQDTSIPTMVTTLSKTRATETSFKQLSGKKNRIIHLATHGFYITKNEANQMTGHPIINTNVNDSYVEDRELLRSGLLMAGAMIEKKEKNDDDGILTALEVAGLDLSSADLIVLSACETALGDVSTEGVFGLQRGFKKAGAQSLLMSLWKVDDTATQILMTEFYKGLTLGQSKREALLNAQKYLRQYQNGKYDKPEYWAAFILLDGIN